MFSGHLQTLLTVHFKEIEYFLIRVFGFPLNIGKITLYRKLNKHSFCLTNRPKNKENTSKSHHLKSSEIEPNSVSSTKDLRFPKNENMKHAC